MLVKAAKAVSPADPGAFARCEATLLQAATELSFVPFANAVTYFIQMADPDGAEEADLARRARRDAYVVESMHGMYLVGGNLDPISGAIVAGELARLEEELFEAEWAEAKEALGRDPKVHELERTPAQRRADALVEMAVRSKGAKAGERRPLPRFSVLVGYETIHGRICRIEGGPIVTPGALLPWLDEASFERIVFSPGTRIECSKTARFFTGATRRAIEVRDQYLHPSFLRDPRRALSDRPHRPLHPRGRDHPGERKGPLWLPQPAAQPRATRCREARGTRNGAVRGAGGTGERRGVCLQQERR